jgi:diketogulonate reductase-like aldo/keto reductase
MQELAMAGGKACATHQILYNLGRRGAEFGLLPWLAERSIPIMAYSPVEQGRLVSHRGLREVAERKGATPAQAALAWLLRQPDVIAIPKAASRAHVEENQKVVEILLDDENLAVLDRPFPPPPRSTPLEML